eukprot:m.145716 g.145716  ORF g.145716 m.145716 type:complete len:70 (-) comp11630_c0_seq5:167-376(-)
MQRQRQQRQTPTAIRRRKRGRAGLGRRVHSDEEHPTVPSEGTVGKDGADLMARHAAGPISCNPHTDGPP